MSFHAQHYNYALKTFGTDEYKGLNDNQIRENIKNYGTNSLTKNKKPSVFSRIINALKEPMLLILLASFLVTFGVNLGKFFKTGEGDFIECIGILFAIALSVSITLVMEGSSEKAFATLNKIYESSLVKVIRNGVLTEIEQSKLCVGDIVLIDSGDKIFADGRLIYSNYLSIDESALTGESNPVEKNAQMILHTGVPLAERKNLVYSGTFVSSGSGKMVVTAVGDRTEIGNIAGELKDGREQTPLQQKLNKLGKIITLTGGACAIIVFLLSAIKLAFSGNFTFNSLQELFLSCIVLVVAAVPEGLPTIVAVSLALNMIKLAKEKVLIKKMTATETAGAVNVICSDKTGTLTQNKMTVVSVCMNEFCSEPENLSLEPLLQNFVCNNTAELILEKGKKTSYKGSGTECALLNAFEKNKANGSVENYRNRYKVIDRTPFSSDSKVMKTTVAFGDINRELVKGAPEIVLQDCALTDRQKSKIISSMLKYQKKSCRILCFAHRDFVQDKNSPQNLFYDGFVAISDPIRPEVKNAINDCKRAGIKIKMLTGDNVATAYAIALELGITTDERRIINGWELEKLNDTELKKILPKITVVARSTPIIKMRVVKALKEMGEVVAVTGDGINDAPAIKRSDVGFAMGKTGSEITKESSDVVLLDDSFSGVVKAVAFGRNVYRNLQRFLLFQLSVNLSALLFVTVCAVIGVQSPFNAIQLLWINVLMDGPPALTLGLETGGSKLMETPPLKRSESIVKRKTFLRIIFNGVFVCAIMTAQYLCNFLGVKNAEKGSATFTLFVLFQLFNAFNSRGFGAESILKDFTKNKIMLLTFGGVFLLHLIIVQFLPFVFSVSPMCLSSWIKCFFTAFSIVLVSEIAKFIVRKGKRQE